MKDSSTIRKVIDIYEQKEELTDAQFSALYLYTLATSLSFDQIAQAEIDTLIEEEMDNENQN